jgi:hypothetical protein
MLMAIDRSASIHNKSGLAGLILECQRSQNVVDSEQIEPASFGVISDPRRAAAIQKWRGQPVEANPEQRGRARATRWIL